MPTVTSATARDTYNRGIKNDEPTRCSNTKPKKVAFGVGKGTMPTPQKGILRSRVAHEGEKASGKELRARVRGVEARHGLRTAGKNTGSTKNHPSHRVHWADPLVQVKTFAKNDPPSERNTKPSPKPNPGILERMRLCVSRLVSQVKRFFSYCLGFFSEKAAAKQP